MTETIRQRIERETREAMHAPAIPTPAADEHDESSLPQWAQDRLRQLRFELAQLSSHSPIIRHP